jgi:hypothetical protein
MSEKYVEATVLLFLLTAVVAIVESGLLDALSP